MQKFVILSDSRSGTSLFASTLNTHPKVLCHGEVFHKRPTKSHLRGTMAELTADQAETLQHDTAHYLATVFDQPDVDAVGFKMWNNQNPDACLALMADESVAKIIYERTNVLAQFSSSQLVKATGVYNRAARAKDKDRASVQIDFDRALWDKYLRRHNRFFKQYRNKSRGPVLDLSYEDLLRDWMAPVLDFLGVSQDELAPQKKQLYGSDILSRFSPHSHAAVRTMLKEMGREEWVNEQKP